ncbi:hypothetical protein EX30DRAFT_397589 [Ascodesmis nigricans]|uniref:Phospholipase C/D domain-containing protein n=1 Tax=Ascodesmis nigricans TaxID=341454 RepID=A0A4S2MSE9_9PEZI|nr:hypothetical protein EX30DRAFT_397589 [Ascodesmis nigricans]
MKFIALFPSLALLPIASACGVLVHNLVVLRASYIFSLPASHSSHTLISRILTNPSHAPTLQAGAFFPDWGYNCLPSTSTPSESAHWPPFLLAATDYITATFGPLNAPRSDAEQQHLETLLAFIFAAASHQVADATWHAIRLPTGLMAALAAVDFGGDYSKAHLAQDFGGDFLHAARMGRLPADANSWVSNSWNVPIDDVIKIYERMETKVNSLVLRHCMTRGLAALRSELVLGEELLPVYADRAPMLLDEIDGYYLGGMREMAARTVECWGTLAGWVVDGRNASDPWQICDVFQAIAARGGAGEDDEEWQQLRQLRSGSTVLDNPEHVHAIDKLSTRILTDLESIQISTSDFGIETYTLPPQKFGFTHNNDDDLPTGNPTYISAHIPYSHMGSSLAIGNFYFDSTPGDVDNPLALAVGSPFTSDTSDAPHTGDVLVIPWDMLSSSSLTTFNTLTTLTPNPHRTDPRFSTALTPLRLPHLPQLLAISSPGPITYDTSTPPNPPFSDLAPAGRVEVFIPHHTYPSPIVTLTATGADLGGIGGRQFGVSLSSGVVDDVTNMIGEWLIIGSPRSDGLRACFPSGHHSAASAREGKEVLRLGLGEVTVVKFTVSDDDDGNQSITTKSWDIKFPSEARQIECEAAQAGGGYERFGFSTAVIAGLIAISAPGEDAVFLYRFDASGGGGGEGGFNLAATLTPPAKSKSFSHALASTTLTNGAHIIALAAPNEEVDGTPQVGVVRVYRLLSPTANSAEVEFQLLATLYPDPHSRQRYTKFGRSLAFDSTGKERLIIGSGFAFRERGAVWMWDVDAAEKGGEREMEVEVMWVGKEEGGRFGEGVGVGGNGVVVSVPGMGAGKGVLEREFGGVAIFGVAGSEREEEVVEEL